MNLVADEGLGWREVRRIERAKAKALQRVRYVGPASGSVFLRAIQSRAVASRAHGSARLIGCRKPRWLSRAQKQKIKDIYWQADVLTHQTGVLHHVDHIVPLFGETVCGLHVPWNLTPIKYTENLSKGNRHWPDMWQ